MCDCVIFLEGINQVLSILFIKVFYPKVVNDKGKLYGLHLCVHSPDNILLWVYSCFDNRFPSSSFSMSPAWGGLYMPFRISTYTLPSGVDFKCSLYSCMILSGIFHSFSL